LQTGKITGILTEQTFFAVDMRMLIYEQIDKAKLVLNKAENIGYALIEMLGNAANV
jgi:hypothetical protein